MADQPIARRCQHCHAPMTQGDHGYWTCGHCDTRHAVFAAKCEHCQAGRATSAVPPS